MIELLTAAQAEDAAANAMARLLWSALESRGWRDDPDTQALGTPVLEDMAAACRELLRGPVAEASGIDQPHLGGYCMKAPTDPTLRALGRLGAQIVELSYTSRDPVKALAETAELVKSVEKARIYDVALS